MSPAVAGQAGKMPRSPRTKPQTSDMEKRACLIHSGSRRTPRLRMPGSRQGRDRCARGHKKSVSAERSGPSRATEGFDKQDRSKIRELEHPSNTRVACRGRLHPNGNHSLCSSPAAAVRTSPWRCGSILPPRSAADPKTAGRAGRKSAPGRLVRVSSSQWAGWAPKRLARGAFPRRGEPRDAELRRPPAGKLVKWETGAEPGGEHRGRHQRQWQTR